MENSLEANQSLNIEVLLERIDAKLANLQPYLSTTEENNLFSGLLAFRSLIVHSNTADKNAQRTNLNHYFSEFNKVADTLNSKIKLRTGGEGQEDGVNIKMHNRFMGIKRDADAIDFSSPEQRKNNFSNISNQVEAVLALATETFPRSNGDKITDINHKNALIHIANIRANFAKFSNIFKMVEEGIDDGNDNEHTITTLNNLVDLISRQVLQLQGYIEQEQGMEHNEGGESKSEKPKLKTEEEVLQEMDEDIARLQLALGVYSKDNEQLATLVRIRSLVADPGEEDKTVRKTRLITYLRVYRDNLEELERIVREQLPKPTPEPSPSAEAKDIDLEKLKNTYQASRKKLHALNAELIALDKELAENLAQPEEDWVLQKRKAIWQQMDLKDLEYNQAKESYHRSYQNWAKVWTFGNEAPMPVMPDFKSNLNERRLAWQKESTKKRFGLLKKILGRTSIGVAVGAVVGTMLGNGELPRDGENFFDASKLSSTRMAVGQALADSGNEGLTIKTQKDIEINRQEASKLDPVVLPDDVSEVSVPAESAVHLTDSPEIIPEVPFSEPKIQDGVDVNNIFSREALQFGHNPGVELKYPENIGQENLEAIEKMESNRFRVEVPRDVYWNIMEGQTAAGDLPFLSKIKQENKQALIDLVRDRIDADAELRAELGFGKESADQTYIGDEINIELLNKIAEEVAAQNNYLLPGVTLGAIAGETDAISPSEIASVEKMQFDTPNADDGEYKSVAESSAVIVTDSVAEQFKNDFVGGEQAYNRTFNSWVQAIEGFTDDESGWFSSLFGRTHRSTFAVLGKMTVAELANLAKLSPQELLKEIRPLKLPIADVRSWVERFDIWINSKQFTGVKPTSEFSKLANKAFVLEKLTPPPKGEKK